MKRVCLFYNKILRNEGINFQVVSCLSKLEIAVGLHYLKIFKREMINDQFSRSSLTYL